MAEWTMQALLELQALMIQTIPPYPPVRVVCATLDEFSAAFQSIKRNLENENMRVDLSLFQPPPLHLVAMCWTMYCETGEPNVREFSPEAALIREATLRALHAICAIICPGPDSNKFQLVHFVMISQAIDPRIPEPCHILAFKIIRYLSIQNEENRELLTSFFPILQTLVALIRREQPSTEFMREWCAAVKALLLKDDMRVGYNRSDERKRLLFQLHTLRHLSQYLNDYTDAMTLNSIVVLLGSMACHHDYCTSMDQGGVLPALVVILEQFSHHEIILTKNALSLLRFVCMNNLVREKAAGYCLIKQVLNILDLHRDKADVVEVAMSSTAFMTLRCPCGAFRFIEEGGVQLYLQLMQLHFSRPVVQKCSLSTLRNVASAGSKGGRRLMKSLDIEAVLGEVKENHAGLYSSYVKPLLRDLGLAVSPLIVELEEEDDDDDEVTSTVSSGSKQSAATVSGKVEGGRLMQPRLLKGHGSLESSETLDYAHLPRIVEWSTKPYTPVDVGQAAAAAVMSSLNAIALAAQNPALPAIQRGASIRSGSIGESGSTSSYETTLSDETESQVGTLSPPHGERSPNIPPTNNTS